MVRILVLTVSLLVSTIFAKDCGIKSTSSKIVGGSNANENEFPWQVSWRFLNTTTQTHRHICGASIIADTWLITAAHCVDVVTPIAPENFLAIVGAHLQTIPSSNQKIISIKAIYVHPNWDSAQITSDVAVVELAEPIGLDNSNLNAICLGRPTDSTENTNAVISGWGLTEQGAGQIPDILQKATVQVVAQARCRSIYALIKPLTDGEVCAGTNPGGCNGDSGGPLQYEINGRWYLLGAASWVVQCGSTVFPTVWARVPYFLNFISSTSGVSPP